MVDVFEVWVEFGGFLEEFYCFCFVVGFGCCDVFVEDFDCVIWGNVDLLEYVVYFVEVGVVVSVEDVVGSWCGLYEVFGVYVEEGV